MADALAAHTPTVAAIGCSGSSTSKLEGQFTPDGRYRIDGSEIG